MPKSSLIFLFSCVVGSMLLASASAQCRSKNTAPANVKTAPFNLGDWVDVKVYADGRWTGEWTRAQITGARNSRGNGLSSGISYELVDVDGDRLIPALKHGIRSWHLRPAAPADVDNSIGAEEDVEQDAVPEDEYTHDADSSSNDSDDDAGAEADDEEEADAAAEADEDEHGAEVDHQHDNTRAQLLEEIRSFSKASLKPARPAPSPPAAVPRGQGCGCGNRPHRRPRCNTHAENPSYRSLREAVQKAVAALQDNKRPAADLKPTDTTQPSPQPLQLRVTMTQRSSKDAAMQYAYTRSVTVQADSSDTVEVLKGKIEAMDGHGKEQQRLIFKGTELQNRHTLGEYGIRSGTTLQLAMQPKNQPPPSPPPAFQVGDWVQVEVLDARGKFTGRHSHGRIATVPAQRHGRYDLVDVHGRAIRPALQSGIRRWHLKPASSLLSRQLMKQSEQLATVKATETQLQSAVKAAEHAATQAATAAAAKEEAIELQQKASAKMSSVVSMAKTAEEEAKQANERVHKLRESLHKTRRGGAPARSEKQMMAAQTTRPAVPGMP